jgi:hypothetical protein
VLEVLELDGIGLQKNEWEDVEIKGNTAEVSNHQSI